MKIALDYDGTFTEDPAFWIQFLMLAEKYGHQVKIVTMRYPHETIADMRCEVVYTSRQAKSTYFDADIWIDDNPHWIFQNAES